MGRRALTSLQQLQVRGESCIGICQRSKAEVPEMENGGEQREHGVDLLAGKEEEEEERRVTKHKHVKMCFRALRKKKTTILVYFCVCVCVCCVGFDF